MSPYPRKIFLATAVAIDSEMEQRIDAHRRERGSEYLTIEEPLSLGRALRAWSSEADAILVDCLTFWLNNLFHEEGHEPLWESGRFSEEIRDFLNFLEEKPTSLVLVTNEINMGVIPADPLSRRFVDQQGWLNQEVARRADEVILMVSGIPQALKSNPFPKEASLYEDRL